MKMFSCSAVTACQVPCHSLQVSQELQMLSSLNLYSIVNLLRIMASLGNLFWGLQFVNIHGGGGFLFRKLKVSAGRCGRGRSRNPLLCLFSFVEKRDFSILDRSINIYWVFRWYNWLLLVKFRPWAALIRKATIHWFWNDLYRDLKYQW